MKYEVSQRSTKIAELPNMASDFPINTPEEFQKVYEEVKDKKLVATNVLLSGNERTKSAIIARELQPLQQARSLDEIKDVLLEIHDNLMSLDVFDAVEIIISDSDLVSDTATSGGHYHLISLSAVLIIRGGTEMLTKVSVLLSVMCHRGDQIHALCS